MKKFDYMKLLILILPLFAVVTAGLPDSVAVYQLTAEGMASGDPAYCSYFTLISDVRTAVCLPYAAILGCAGFGLAVIYLVTGKNAMLKGVLGCCFGAMTLAVVPVMIKVDAFLLPNMMVPVLLGITCVLAYVQLKKPQTVEEPTKGKKLKKR